MTSVSLLNKTPVSVDVPPANAAIVRARFVMLFEPGGRIVPTIASDTGEISLNSVIQKCRVLIRGAAMFESWQHDNCRD